VSRSIIITGGTGFIGSHLIETFLSNNYTVIALIQPKSSRNRIKEFEANPNLILTESLNSKIVMQKSEEPPELLIHAAWSGVSVSERNSWEGQSQNIPLTMHLLETAYNLGIRKIIGFGSQAEYGKLPDYPINEDYQCNPITAYGTAKLSCLVMFKQFCTLKDLNWNWFRLFSVYGEKENASWLIPSSILNMKSSNRMELTAGDQKYDYIYVKDLAKAIYKITQSDPKSGIYNLASNHPTKLKVLLELLRRITNPEAELDFGAIEYRPGQQMHMEADCTKLFNDFAISLEPNFETNLPSVVDYYT
jgi:UDP-glucose 4-epimerase